MVKMIKIEIALLNNKLAIHIKYKDWEFSKIFRGLLVLVMEIENKVKAKA